MLMCICYHFPPKPLVAYGLIKVIYRAHMDDFGGLYYELLIRQVHTFRDRYSWRKNSMPLFEMPLYWHKSIKNRHKMRKNCGHR